ncbi:MAG: alpha/beta hydrolase [Pseudomonadota bacterium]
MLRRTFLTTGAAATLGACAAVPEDEALRRWPPLGEIMPVGGVDVHYWQRGEGRPVVLIHGASGNLRDFTFDLAPRLAQNHRVIAFDRPGFGYSGRIAERGWDPAVQAALLRQATAELGAERPIIVGHSWGGALTMAWGIDAPDAVSGLVTLGGATMPWGGDISFLYTLNASDVTDSLTSNLIATFATEGLIESFMEGTFAPQPIPEGYAAYVGGPLATRPRTVRYNAHDITNLNAMLERQSKQYPNLYTPVEIVHGAVDEAVWANLHAEGMHALLPNSRLTLLDGVGHMPHHARPEAVVAAVERLSAVS